MEILIDLFQKDNKYIINSKECTNPEIFFILIEARTQLFLGENSKYSILFQFFINYSSEELEEKNSVDDGDYLINK